MLQTETISLIQNIALPSSAPATTTTLRLQALRVPVDVTRKYEVETRESTECVEDLIRLKIQETPEAEAFYIVNLSTVLKKHHQWVSCLPRVKPFYAMKCNPNNAIIKTLASLGVNFDCASKTEIQASWDWELLPNASSLPIPARPNLI
jgi:hypothetical protein